MMEKKILFVGFDPIAHVSHATTVDDAELLRAFEAIRNSGIKTGQVIENIAAFKKMLDDTAHDRERGITINKSRTIGPSTQHSAEYLINSVEPYEFPDIDPDLPFPKSHMDPKGKKTGTKWPEISDKKRKALRKKRKKRKK